MKINTILIYLLVAMTFLSCRKDIVNDPSTTMNGGIEVLNHYTIDIEGLVVSETGVPIPGAKLVYQGIEIESSDYGTFQIKNVSAPETGLFIHATATGHFAGGATVYSNSNQKYKLDIMLTPYQDYIDYESGDGVDFITDEGTYISIPQNGIKDASGNLYSGSVRVNMDWINPISEDMYQLAPGSMVAIQDDERVNLRSFGMIGVEIFSPSGEELNLADGVEATLSFPLPSEIIGEAPSEIDLWHFDEVTGVWLKEGVATLSGNVYSAKVSHFSWWNCDVAFAITELCVTVLNDRGETMPNVQVSLDSGAFGVATGYTDENGVICGPVPQGDAFELTVSTLCGEILAESVIGPFEGDFGVATATIPFDSNEIDNVTIFGQLTCGGTTPVTNGYIVMQIDGETYIEYVDGNGQYAITYINCLGNTVDATLIGFDLDALQTGTASFQAGADDQTVDLNSCQEDISDQTMILTTPTEDLLLIECTANISVAEVTVTAQLVQQDGTNAFVILGINGFGEDTYTANLMTHLGGSFNNGEQQAATATITQYGSNPGDVIIGSFSWGDLSGDFSAQVQ